MKNFKMNIKKVVINNKVVKLFKKNPKLTWAGTQADLVEIVYYIRMTRMVKNDRGREATMTELTKAFFDLLIFCTEFLNFCIINISICNMGEKWEKKLPFTPLTTLEECCNFAA